MKQVLLKLKTRTSKSLFLALWAFQLVSYAQTIVTVPEGNPNDTTRRFPITSWYDFNRTQILFKNSELGFSNKRINSIGFYVQSRTASVKDNIVRVRIKTTTDTVLAAVPYASTLVGSSEVFSGTIVKDSIAAGKWVTIKLQTPFNFSGNENLVVLIESERDVAGNNEGDDNSKRFRYSRTNAPRFQKWWSDHFIPSGDGIVENVRPNVQFGVSEIPSQCTGIPEGGTVNVSNSSFPCTGPVVQLNVGGYSQNLGIQLQWQRKIPAATGVWEDIPGATFEDVSQTVTASAKYRCKVTCSSSAQSSFSSEAQVEVTAPFQDIPFDQGFGALVQTEGQTFPLGCGYTSETISGARGWRATLGRNPDQAYFKGVAGRTDSSALYSGWSTESYFFLPSMNLSSDSTYTLSLWYKHSRSGDNNEGPSFDVRVGKLPEAGAQTILLVTKNNQNDTIFQELSTSYRPEVTGPANFSVRNRTTSSNPFYLVIDDIKITKSLFVSVLSKERKGRISVFPNPNKGSFQVSVPQGFLPGQLEVFGLNGNLIHKTSLSGGIPVSFSNLPKGLYLLKITNHESVFTERMLVE